MRLISIHHETRNAARVGAGWCVAPVDCDALEILAGFIVTRSWSPIVWRDGLRHQSAFLYADFLALDFDGDGMMTLAEAQRSFADCRHVIGLTKSHGLPKGHKPPADRFRVVMPFERRITSLAEYRYTVGRYARRYDADELCIDGARFFFPCRNTVGLPVTEGFEQDVYEPPPPEPPPDYTAFRAIAGSMPRWCEGLLRFGCPEARRNTTCFRLGLHLTLCGFTVAQIVDRIMASPIPIGPHVRDEVLEAVVSGARRAKEELSGSAQEGQEDNTGASRGGFGRSAGR